MTATMTGDEATKAAEEKKNAPDKPERERVLGLVAGPDDGYTLRGKCTPSDPKKAPLNFTYRPCLPDATFQFRVANAQAEDGPARLESVLVLLAAHLVTWDLKAKAPNGHPVPLPFTPEALRKPGVLRALGAEYLDQMANHVNGYTLGEWEADAKNS